MEMQKPGVSFGFNNEHAVQMSKVVCVIVLIIKISYFT